MVIKLFKTHLEYCKGHFQRFYCKSIEFHWEKNNVLDQKEKTWKLKKEFLAKNIRNGIYISSTESARSPVYVRFQMSSSSSELTFPGPWNPHVSDCVSRSDAERIEILPKMQRTQEDDPPITMWIIWRHGLECWGLGWISLVQESHNTLFCLQTCTIADSAQIEYCSTFHCPSVVRVCVCQLSQAWHLTFLTSWYSCETIVVLVNQRSCHRIVGLKDFNKLTDEYKWLNTKIK